MKSLQELVIARIGAKRAEDDAIASRRKIDVQIAEMMRDPKKDEGSVSEKFGCVKVTTTFGIDRKVNTEALTADWMLIGPAAQAAFRFKAEVTTAAYKALTGDDLAAAAAYVTAKPSSPSVKVEAEAVVS